MPLEVDKEMENSSVAQEYHTADSEYVPRKLAKVQFNPRISPNDGSAVIRDSREAELPVHVLAAHRNQVVEENTLRQTTHLDTPLHMERGVPTMLSLRGGSQEDEERSTIPDHSHHMEYLLTPRRNWINLYGFLGCVPFVPTDFSTYSSAVDKLFSLSSRGLDKSQVFYLIRFNKNGTEQETVIEDRTPLSSTGKSATYLRDHFADTTIHHQECCAWFLRLGLEQSPVALEPQQMQLQTDIARIGHCLFDMDEDPDQKIKSYAYLPFPKAKGAAAFDVAEFAANQYNPRLQEVIDVLIGTPPGKFHNAIFSLYDENEPSGKFSFDLAAGSLGASGVHTEVWNRLHPLNSPSARWMLKISHIPDDEIAVAVPNYYRPRFPTLTQADTANVPSAVRRLVKQVWTPAGIKKMESVQLRAGSASLEGPVRHPDILEIEIDQPNDGDQLSELDDGLNQLISAPSKPWLMLSPQWKHGESRIYPSWVDGDRDSVELPGLGSSFEEFENAIVSLCEKNPQQSFEPRKHSVFVKSISDHGPSITPALDVPACLIGPETDDKEWFRIRSYITSCSIEVFIISGSRSDWNSRIPKSIAWGVRRVPQNSQYLAHGISPLDPSFWNPLLPRGYIGPRTPPHLVGGFQIWEDNPQGNDGPRATEPGPDESASNLPERPTISEDARNRSLYMQPSMFDELVPEIPMSAPPAEHIMRTTSQVPMISQAILTPSEQARTGEAVWNLRNLLTSRAWKCAYADCNFTCSLNDVQTIHGHLENKHGPVSKCMWCKTRLFEYWSEEQRMEHLRTKHMDKLTQAMGGGMTRMDSGLHVNLPATHISDPAVGSSQVRQSRQGPQPQIQTGARILVQQTAAPAAPAAQQSTHQNILPSQNPISGSQPPPRTLRYPLLNWYDFPGPTAYIDPCRECPMPNCPEPNLSNLDSHQVYNHFQTHHPDTKIMCPFCHLPFSNRAIGEVDAESSQRPEDEIIKHFDCHVHRLWDHLQPQKRIDDPQIRVMKPSIETRAFKEGKKCPLFSSCGAIIQCMTDEQFVEHLRNSHRKDLGIPEDSVPTGKEETREGILNSEPRPRRPLAGIHGTSRAESNYVVSDISGISPTHDEWSLGNSPDQSPSANMRSRPRGRKRNRVEISESEQPNARASASMISKATSASSQGKATQNLRAKRARFNRATDREGEGERGDESELGLSPRGRSGARTVDNGETHQQRSPSPDWDDILGPISPSFVPSEDMYCSKCLRKAPKLLDQSPGRSNLGRSVEMELHTAPNRCCRIRNGVGMAQNLPNRSGWIEAKDLRGQKLGAIKDGFLKKYPGYAQTLYPTKPLDHNTSLWRSDPNNEDNKLWWDIPWPPFEGTPPFPGEWEYPGTPELEHARRRRDPKPARRPHDSLYRYRSDDDSDDGLEPDVDDTQQFRGTAPVDEANIISGRTRTPKRKQPEVADNPPDLDGEIAQLKDGPSKRPKKEKSGPRKKVANAPQKKPGQPTRGVRSKPENPAEPATSEDEDEENASGPEKTKARAKPQSKAPMPKKTRARAAAPPTRASTRTTVVKQREAREAKKANTSQR